MGARQLVTLRALAAGAITASDLAEAGGTAAAATSLAARGLALKGTRGVRRVPVEFRLSEADLSRDLPATAPQAAAIDAVIGAMGTGRGFLLHGVTGSGKTEV
jgi:primosomal protein N'